MTTSHQPVVLAAGGTGGHIFPAEALAEALHARGERVVLITDPRFANFETGIFSEIERRTIRAGGLSGPIHKKILGAFNLLTGIMQARKELKALQPKVVVGFGGYPSFPTMVAATKLKYPTVIHEQNAVLGRANRWLAGKVNRIGISFHQTMMIKPEDEHKLVFTGNPVRAGVRAVHDVPYSELNMDGKLNILVTGGSQGASIFSQILPAAMAAMPASLRSRIRIDQQCREADLEITRAAYEQLGVSANLASFFTDIPAKLSACHLVIARSGASTLAELTVAGRPAILVPYPHAMDNHQYFNANAFEDAGGGWVMPQDGFTATALATRLESFLNLPATLSKAASCSRRMGQKEAAAELATLALDTAARLNNTQMNTTSDDSRKDAA